MTQFHSLIISDIRPITEDATTIVFAVPEEFKAEFNFKPGQYLTLRFDINGHDVRRSYSICSAPHEGQLRVGVKRVKQGLVSNYIADTLKVSDVVEVMSPNGLFFADVNKENYKTYYLFAAGSGITPILSILKTVLETEVRSYVYMLYGNQHQQSIMFLNELQELNKKYSDRFFLVHSLSRPKGILSELVSTVPELEFQKGRIDAGKVAWFLNDYQPYAQDTEYYICGPREMIDSAVTTLKNLDVPQERIFVERFNTSAVNTGVVGIAAELTAYLEGEKIGVSIKQGQTLLRGLIEAGHNPPFSCEGGVCATCLCKLKKGQVHMKNNLVLSDEEVAKGTILSCQSLALTQELEIEY